MANRCFASLVLGVAVGCVALPGFVLAQDVAVTKEDIKIGGKEYSPYLYQSYPNRVFWGDTHLHTSYSTDAGMVGNTLGPDEALRFAKGEKVTSSTGLPARLIRPLDFLVVADHAETLGLAPMIEASDPELLKDPTGKRWHDMVKAETAGTLTRSGRRLVLNRKTQCPIPLSSAAPGSGSLMRWISTINPASLPLFTASSGPRHRTFATCTEL